MGTTALGPGDPERLGRFRLVARLGSGGMGEVYRARSASGRTVAVKTVRPELARDSEFRRRFAREVAAARRVSGAFTAAVVDADTEGNPPWLATSYVPGVPLADAIAEHGPWPHDSVLLLAAGLAEALEAIHQADVVHRDLKPANIILAPDGPRVIDFGISVATDLSAVTRTGGLVGTPGFMSPEQLTGKPVTPASDVFALGLVLAFTATGAGAFGSGPQQAVSYRIVHERPDLDQVPQPLRNLVARCLAKKPERRPSPSSLADLLGTAAVDVHPNGQETTAFGYPETVAHAVTSQATRLLTEGAPTSSWPNAAPASERDTVAPDPAPVQGDAERRQAAMRADAAAIARSLEHSRPPDWPAADIDYNRALLLARSGASDEARDLLRSAAWHGHQEAARIVSSLDRDADASIIELDPSDWRAAELGDAAAMKRLSDMLFLIGRRDLALNFARHAAETGDPEAMNKVGVLLESHQPWEADQWFRRAAEAGDEAGTANARRLRVARRLDEASRLALPPGVDEPYARFAVLGEALPLLQDHAEDAQVRIRVGKMFRTVTVGGWVLGSRYFSGDERSDGTSNHYVMTEEGTVGTATLDGDGYRLWEPHRLSEKAMRHIGVSARPLYVTIAEILADAGVDFPNPIDDLT